VVQKQLIGKKPLEKLPALLGGSPLTKYADWPTWPPRLPELNAALAEVVEEDQWGIRSAGIKQFEERFAEYHGAQYGLAMANGTVALVAALRALNVGPGDEVILPAYTFMATAAAILNLGAMPVLADLDPATFNLDPAAAERAITGQTKVILPVHIGGNPADMTAFLDIADRHNIAILEDAAQAPGAQFDGKGAGSWGNAGCFSFQSSKNLTAGEGGIVLTNDKELYKRLFEIYNCGRSLDGAWYEHLAPGMNYRISAFQAAVLLTQMDYLDEWAQRREENGVYLEGLLNSIPGISCAGRESKTERNAYHLLIFTYDSDEFNGLPKSRFLKAMQAEGVIATEGYQPIYDLPFIEYSGPKLPVTEIVCRQGVWLRQFQLLANRSLMDKIGEAVDRIRKFSAQLARPAADEFTPIK